MVSRPLLGIGNTLCPEIGSCGTALLIQLDLVIEAFSLTICSRRDLVRRDSVYLCTIKGYRPNHGVQRWPKDDLSLCFRCYYLRHFARDVDRCNCYLP